MDVPTVGTVHFAAEYGNMAPPAMRPAEIPWEYLQLASYVRDSLLVRQLNADMALCFGP
ncbi:MAG: hypothetical protein HFF17_01105 [Oscillospiraceae bacterium]|nr:hypothetical protein [Oscillospiraceae bacterium]